MGHLTSVACHSTQLIACRVYVLYEGVDFLLGDVGKREPVGAGFFPARKTGVCYGYRAGVALGSQKQSIHA